MAVAANTPIELVSAVYDRLAQRTDIGRRRLGRPLTLAEKILFNHLADPEHQELERGHSYGELYPDRVAMQDATAQMALLQFMTAGLSEVAVPSTVHCDHLIQAQTEGRHDLAVAERTNAEVYDFLATVSAKYGVGFWKPGSGIIHQVVLEQYAFPGGMMVGTDSHTPNAGGLGMIAVGVGGADAVDVMVGGTFGVRWPKLIGVHLTGEMHGWTSAKDVILRVAEVLTVQGGTGAIVEYFGPGAATLSATGKGTICNMGAEIGATTSLFPYDSSMAAYLGRTERIDIAELANAQRADLQADPDVEADPRRFFDRVIEIDLETLEPNIVGPHTPDLGRSTAAMGDEARKNNWPTRISNCLVGSCTNSSYEDIARSAHVARQATARGLQVKVPLYVTPGSERVRATIERDGLLADLETVGATVLANACGPCIGQWKRTDIEPGETNSILSSYNRNFPKRNDGNATTLSFLASPEIVMAYALVGSLDFDPLTDPVEGALLDTPSGADLPDRGFERGEAGFVAPPEDGSHVDVVIRDGSDRLQRLEPFPAWNGHDFEHLTVLMKARGKCTTDHISAAGPWLKYRGHLDNISQNLFLSVNNAFSDMPGHGIDEVDGTLKPLPDIARHYRNEHVAWVAIGDENYGEGSSREHAAMEPRYMNCKAVITRSFARIHETNLKKQGVLPLTFADAADYDRIGAGDHISVLGLNDLAPEQSVSVRIDHADNSSTVISCNHTMSAEHITWFRAGGALNVIRQRAH